MKSTHVLLTVAMLTAGACDFNITDPNNPPPIGNNPSRPQVQSAASGILVAARSDAADWNLDVGIMGREAYRFDGSDPRFIDELIEGPLDPGGGAFGGDHWTEHYAAIRATNDLLNVIGTATALSAEEQSATRGFAETMQAYSFLMVLMGHTEDSIPIDVNRDATQPPAPFVTNDSAYGFVTALLDLAQTHLTAGGTAFPFNFGGGFNDPVRGDFSTVANFLKFNRALKARVEVYRGSGSCGNTCYTAALAALAAAFVDTSGPATLDDGVYHVYSTNPGDAANPLFQNPITGENLVHPSIRDSVATKPGGGDDNRFATKVITRPTTAQAGVPLLTSNLGWIRYSSPDAPVPIIRNEELILLRAEANNALGNATQAANDINYIRVNSGGLAAIAGLSGLTQAQILDELLVQKKYSLLYEGHRWVDMRRLGRLNQILIDRPDDNVFSTLPIPTSEVLPRLP
ncbi:MAG: RagB/SusD family nutrient uptake outer membrane protein [Gemmatimonadales bacterium]